MKILLVGNHSCGNRGDAAILRGLIDSLESNNNDIELDVVSRFPYSSSYLLSKDIKKDKLSEVKYIGNNIFNKLIKRFFLKILPNIYISKINKNGILRFFKLPKKSQEFVNDIKKYDAIIQVGGSFLVDLYGVLQYEHILCSLLAKKPIYLIGHSVGPFDGDQFSAVSSFCLSRVNKLVLRESVSLDIMREYNIDTSKVSDGIDTAFLVNSADVELYESYVVRHWKSIIQKTKTIALTVRKLAPFDKRLGVSQELYENSIANLIDKLILDGYQVLAVSTCTGIESYDKDDRMICVSIRNKVKYKDSFHIVMDELNDVELGCVLSNCYLTIGTRLHSAIISMNFNTPAIAINYEHKSLGIMNKLGLPDFSVTLDDLLNNKLYEKIKLIEVNYHEVKLDLKNKIEFTKKNGENLIVDVINEIGGL